MPKKKTHEEYVKELKEVNPDIEVIGTYINATTKIKHKCLIHDYPWDARPADLLNGHGCPECGLDKMRTTQAKTHMEYLTELSSVTTTIIPLKEYVNTNTPIYHKCLDCGHKWKVVPKSLLNGHGCQKCYFKTKTKTHDNYIKELEIKNIKIKPIEVYINASTPIMHKCETCGKEWPAAPDTILGGQICPKCKKEIEHKKYLEKLKKVNSTIIPLEQYSGATTYITHKCLKCGRIYKAKPTDLLNGRGCKRCATINRTYTHNYYIQRLQEMDSNYYPIEEYINSSTPIWHECKICGHKWTVTPEHILQGRGCPRCAENGTSYQDKRAYEYLSELYPQTKYRDKTLIGMELDIVIPELKIAFEPGNWYFHNDKLERDALKRELCKEKGYICYTLYDSYPENTPPPFEEQCWIANWDNGQNKDKYDVILQSLKELWEVTQCQL